MKSVRFWTRISIVAWLAVMAIQFQNCSSYNDPSPFELGSSSGTLNIASDQVALESPTIPADVSQPRSLMTFDGVCSVGTSAVNHYIEFQISNNGRFATISPDKSACPDMSSSDSCTHIRNVKCEHGKYHLLIGGQRTDLCPPGANTAAQLRMTGQLVTIDAAGKETRLQSAFFETYFAYARISAAMQLDSVCN